MERNQQAAQSEALMRRQELELAQKATLDGTW